MPVPTKAKVVGQVLMKRERSFIQVFQPRRKVDSCLKDHPLVLLELVVLGEDFFSIHYVANFL